MLYSFSKSAGIPFHKFFSKVNEHTHTPLRATWLLVFCAFVLGLPLLKSYSAFLAVISLTNIALLCSYAIPIACRLTISRNTFVRGPFHLGQFSGVIGWTAVGWTAIATVRLLSNLSCQ